MEDQKKRRSLKDYPKDVYCFADTVEMMARLLDGGARIIQYRDKYATDAAFFATADRMRKRAEPYDALFIVNDRVDAALAAKAGGVHVGQEDEHFKEVIRRVPGEMMVGVSARTVEEAAAAEAAGADHLGVGSILFTPTKPDSVVIGLEGLSAVVNAVSIPIVAIGGITLENAAAVMEAGADFLAVISHINNAENVGEQIRRFREIARKAR
jgi:thiamine-phosphate pyrophosphorylase